MPSLACLFDHLIGRCEQRCRDCYSESFCGPHVEPQFDLSWLLDRQIGGIGSPQNSLHVVSRPDQKFLPWRTVREKAAESDDWWESRKERNMLVLGKSGNPVAKIHVCCILEQMNHLRLCSCKRCKRAVYFFRQAQRDGTNRHPHRARTGYETL